jgi:hypothetical protein
MTYHGSRMGTNLALWLPFYLCSVAIPDHPSHMPNANNLHSFKGYRCSSIHAFQATEQELNIWIWSSPQEPTHNIEGRRSCVATNGGVGRAAEDVVLGSRRRWGRRSGVELAWRPRALETMSVRWRVEAQHGRRWRRPDRVCLQPRWMRRRQRDGRRNSGAVVGRAVEGRRTLFCTVIIGHHKPARRIGSAVFLVIIGVICVRTRNRTCDGQCFSGKHGRYVKR